jgi:PmbA protein
MTTTATLFETEIQTVLDLAKAKGLTDVEVYARRDVGLQLKAQKGELESFQRSDSVGVGVRVLLGERVGYAYTENLDKASLARVLDEAASNAEIVEPEPGAGLAKEQPLDGTAPVLYNPKLDEVPLAEKIALAKKLEETAYATDKRIRTVPYSSYSDSTSFVRIANSKGVDRSYRSNAAFAFSYATEGTENKVAFESQATRDFASLDVDLVAGVAARHAVARLGSKQMTSGHFPVVFSPQAMAELLSTYSVMFSAKSAQEGKSLLAGQEGQTIASGLFRLVDDPLLATGFATRPFDDEGVPSRSLVLVENGVFKSFLHNTQTANHAGVASTGHAARGSYKGTLAVAPSNFFVPAGTTRFDELVAGPGAVLVIDDLQGLHAGTNTISGDFSLQAQGFLYQDGQLAHPVHNFTVAGNFLTMLKDIVALGDDLRFFPQGAYIGSPSVKVKDLAIAGA